MNRFQPWQLRPGTGFDEQIDLVGYRVAGTDEEIGTVAEVVDSSGDVTIVIDTGAWVVGQRILLPPGTVESIDHDARSIAVDRTATEIRDAPPYEVETGRSQEYRDRLTHYYCDLYRDLDSPESGPRLRHGRPFPGTDPH
ncbi:hypothetical protein FB561_5754 [Kribbella amoyensis]|uniref:PRC-barrel domain-containing protein n=1 Tax=Kribbella amoyensis TaxID=996641 RepID=A0A561C096_9ACTN|nr:PRC-barrel domain-containing protein [Kribbella amoyensis]TWD84561.1 hypothetical protein FB561_5754 [Kribbella amoyensis]